MRRKFVFGVGLAGILSGSALGQFASDRGPIATPPATTAPFGGLQPAASPFGGGRPVGTSSDPATPPRSGGYVPPVGGFQPATSPTPQPGGFQPAGHTAPAASAPATVNPADIPTALGQNHPLAVKPEYGAYFICVKSYSRPARPDPADPGLTARELAEGLAHDIRQNHPEARVLLYEYISEEKKAEAQARAEARKRAEAFAAALSDFRQKSQLQGMHFLEADQKIKYQTFRYRDQIAVFVGGYPTEDDAVKELRKVKKWLAPRDNRLMDGGVITKPGADGKLISERSYLNPFTQAMIVPNPTVPRSSNKPTGNIDPFLVKLNEGRPYSLLKATKNWTLGVKSFSGPVTLQSKDASTSTVRLPSLSKAADIINASSEQAEMLAKMLREMRGPSGQPLNLESFVMHTWNGSFVTVGQFDSPNDPALLETRRMLSSLRFTMSRDTGGQQVVAGGDKLFGDQMLPVPVPKP